MVISRVTGIRGAMIPSSTTPIPISASPSPILPASASSTPRNIVGGLSVRRCRTSREALLRRRRRRRRRKRKALGGHRARSSLTWTFDVQDSRIHSPTSSEAENRGQSSKSSLRRPMLELTLFRFRRPKWKSAASHVETPAVTVCHWLEELLADQKIVGCSQIPQRLYHGALDKGR